MIALTAIIVFSLLLLKEFWLISFYGTLFTYTRKFVLKTRDASRCNLVNILGETPRFVWLAQDGIELEIPFENMHVGDLIVVHTGEVIPVDGRIVSGLAVIDQHVLTGEAQPVEKDIEAPVYAGTLLLSGSITLCVEKSGF